MVYTLAGVPKAASPTPVVDPGTACCPRGLKAAAGVKKASLAKELDGLMLPLPKAGAWRGEPKGAWRGGEPIAEPITEPSGWYGKGEPKGACGRGEPKGREVEAAV